MFILSCSSWFTYFASNYHPNFCFSSHSHPNLIVSLFILILIYLFLLSFSFYFTCFSSHAYPNLLVYPLILILIYLFLFSSLSLSNCLFSHSHSNLLVSPLLNIIIYLYKYVLRYFFTDRSKSNRWLLQLKKFKPSHMNIWILMCFFLSKMVTFFLKVRFLWILSKKCMDCTDFFPKNLLIVRIFSQKIYWLYGFVLKMCWFFQQSFGHPYFRLTLKEGPNQSRLF